MTNMSLPKSIYLYYKDVICQCLLVSGSYQFEYEVDDGEVVDGDLSLLLLLDINEPEEFKLLENHLT